MRINGPADERSAGGADDEARRSVGAVAAESPARIAPHLALIIMSAGICRLRQRRDCQCSGRNRHDDFLHVFTFVFACGPFVGGGQRRRAHGKRYGPDLRRADSGARQDECNPDRSLRDCG